MSQGKRVSSKSMKAGAFAETSEKQVVPVNGLKAGLTRWLVALPLPVMVLALLIETVSADIFTALALLVAIALQLAGIGLVRRGLTVRQSGGVEAALNSPSTALGLGSAALVAALFLLCLSGPAGPLQAIGVAALGAIGLWLALFTSTGAEQASNGLGEKVAGIDMGDLRKQLAQAHDYVKRMRTSGAQLSSSDNQAQVVRIADHAEGVLEGILADPGDIRRARRFMATYVERAATSVEQFAAAETKGKADGHRADFNATLDVIEKAFNDQKQRLDAEDSIDLEVQLDVLRKQMEREGL
ncbi:5-bromo-4-chloroindolyl phosphate hydrolysis family protein [Alphaproteobacteria bacterium]|nr:5-bromo-4-chloroindolyl phosphate hydrolysis family protein [Alphaproteobacteria bacterium]